MRRLSISIRLAALCCCLSLTLFSQTEQSKRPKIGLVLEGGGALGFAHIGVIQWLEEHRIPVDMVAGTSMGGLIGGLYASGERPEEIRALARDINWDKTLSGAVPLQELDFRRKQDLISYPSRLEFGLKHGISLPGGLNSGHEIGLILDRAVLPYFDLHSFDDLPIPFRCVATEMVSGTQTIFDHGSLATALRSTMSIPAVFSPVQDHDKIYTDGGALNNLPVDVAKKMGADIVIAVYLNTGADDPKTFNSLLGAAGRNISIMIAANEVRSMQLADVLLSADLKGFTSSDFGKSEAIVPKGVEAASKKALLLERFALNESDWKQHLEARNAKRRSKDVPKPQFISVEGTSAERQAGIESNMAQFINKRVDPSALDRELRKLRGSGVFDRLGYTLADRNGQTGVAIQAVEKSYAPPFLNLGVDIAGADIHDIRFGLAARATFFDLGGYRSELRVDGSFGVNNGLQAEYYHPFTSTSKWFIAPRAYATQRDFNVYRDQLRIAQYALGDSGFGADLGYTLTRRSELRVGEALDWESGKLRIGQPLVPNGSTRRGISSLHYDYLGQDDPVIPRRGLSIQSAVSYYSKRPLGGTGYTAATLKVSDFIPVSRKGSLFLTASGGSAFGATGLGGSSFALGGPLKLGAYGENELLGNQFYLFQGGYLHELFRLNPLLGDAVYAVGFYELGKIYGPLLPNTPANPMDGTAAILMKTLVGPVFAGGSIGDSGHRKWWFGIGRVF